MRLTTALAAMAALALSLPLTSCGGSDEKTVIVNPPPGSAVVVPPAGVTKVCPSGQTTC